MVMACSTTKSVKDHRGHFGFTPILHAKPRRSFFEDVTMKKIQLANNRGVVLVDDADFPSLSKRKWFIKKEKHTSYAVAMIYRDGKRTTIRMHREILGLKKGDKHDGEHQDGDGLNNQRFNLRKCTRSQNSMNQHKTYGSSQYKGVSLYKPTGKWRAEIMKDGKSHYLGAHALEDEAARVYDEAAKELFGEFANTNFN